MLTEQEKNNLSWKVDQLIRLKKKPGPVLNDEFRANFLAKLKQQRENDTQGTNLSRVSLSDIAEQLASIQLMQTELNQKKKQLSRFRKEILYYLDK